jgi:hypothetical protein
MQGDIRITLEAALNELGITDLEDEKSFSVKFHYLHR